MKSTGGGTSHSQELTNSTHIMASSPRIELRPHWWRVIALTTVPTMFPKVNMLPKFVSSRKTLARIGNVERTLCCSMTFSILIVFLTICLSKDIDLFHNGDQMWYSFVLVFQEIATAAATAECYRYSCCQGPRSMTTSGRVGRNIWEHISVSQLRGLVACFFG